MTPIQLSVFTKPWPSLRLQELAAFVRGMGVSHIELPVRPGYQVEPEHALRDLPQAVRILAECGVGIASIASEFEPHIIEACQRSRIGLIRAMAPVHRGESYTEAERRLRQEYAAIEPLLLRAGVEAGIQNHQGSYVPNALGLRALLDGLDPAAFVAVWDAAHEALVGMPPEFALDVVSTRLGMVNLKNARRVRQETGEWQVEWTEARSGFADWRAVIGLLAERGYSGTLCLTAEYSDRERVDQLIAQDVAYARDLLTSVGFEVA